MKTMKKSGLAIAVSALLSIAFAPHVHAQISASTSLTGLKFELIDLNTADDVTPYARFNGQFDSALYGVPLTVDAWSSIPYSTLQDGGGSFDASVYNGSISVGSRSVSSALQFTADDINSPFYQQTFDDYIYVQQGEDVNPDTGLLTRYQESVLNRSTYVNLDANGVHDSFSAQEGDESAFNSFAQVTLSPGTLLMVRGLATVNTRADSQVLADALAQAGFANNGASLGASVSASHLLELSRGDTYTDNVSGPGSGAIDGHMNNFLLSSLVSFTNQGIAYQELDADPMVLENSTSRELFVAYENFSDQDVTLTLVYQQAVRVSVTGTLYSQVVNRRWGQVVDSPTAPVIPEPGTWALMGLGLGAVTLARRRQTRITRQAHA